MWDECQKFRVKREAYINMKKNTLIVEREERRKCEARTHKNILNLRMNFAFEGREILRTEKCYIE